MKKSASLIEKLLSFFAPSKVILTSDKVKADIIPLLLTELDKLKDLKIFMGPMDKKPEVVFTQIQINRQLILECEENLIENTYSLTIFKKQKNLIRSTLIKSDYREMLTLFFDLLFVKTHQTGIDLLRTEIDTNNNQINLNSSESEAKSREWLRVTNEVYKKALLEVSGSHELILDFSLQLNLEDEEPFIIFKSYNLFWQMKFQKNSLLRVIFYNDKDAKTQNKPSLSGDFYHQKNQIWDEFTKALSMINQTQSRK